MTRLGCQWNRQPVAALPIPVAEAALLAIDAEPLPIRDAASASDDSGHTRTTANSMASIVKKVCVVFFFWRADLLAIKLSESPFTNDLRKFQEIASGTPLAMVAVAIDYVSPDLRSLCHYKI
jgi:hypothetical protein